LEGFVKVRVRELRMREWRINIRRRCDSLTSGRRNELKTEKLQWVWRRQTRSWFPLVHTTYCRHPTHWTAFANITLYRYNFL